MYTFANTDRVENIDSVIHHSISRKFVKSEENNTNSYYYEFKIGDNTYTAYPPLEDCRRKKWLFLVQYPDGGLDKIRKAEFIKRMEYFISLQPKK